MIAVRFIAIVAAIAALYARSCNAELERNDESEIVPPIIDFSRLTYDMPLIPIDLFEQIEDALTNHGAFVAVNHSVWLTDQQRAFGAANNLFGLPLQEKESLQFNQSNHFGRGYLSFGAESGLSANFEPKEGYSFGHPKHLSYSPEKTWLRSPNLWPKDWTEHEIQPFNNIYEKFSSLAELFLSFIIYARKVYRGKSTNIMVGGGSEISILRLFHYFPIESELVQQALAHQESQRGKERILGSSPHTDWGLLTIIMQNSVTGLQYRKNQKWVNVPYIPESLIFNCGDYFSLATDGDYHAPVHRVLSPQNQERLSFVYFFYPHFDSPLTWDKSAQNTAVVDASGNSNVKKEVAQQTKADEKLEYNTLSVLNYEELSVSDYDKGRTEKFGDYIIKKWQGVYRG